MSTHQLTTYLDSQQIDYTLINHSLTYTAQETAQSAHIPGREVAKTVVVMIDGVPRDGCGACNVPSSSG